MKNKTQKFDVASIVLISAFALVTGGCGTSANLAGLGVSVNVAQKGVAAGLTLNAGTNSLMVGGSFASGTNSVGGTVTIPTGN
jgi:hypothetical protein